MSRVLVEAGADDTVRSREGDTLLHEAAIRGHTTIVQLILADPRAKLNVYNASGCTPLQLVVKHDCVASGAALLADVRVDPNTRSKPTDYTSLHWVAFIGHTDIAAQLFTSLWLDVNATAANGVTVLHVAAMAGHVIVIRCLMGGAST